MRTLLAPLLLALSVTGLLQAEHYTYIALPPHDARYEMAASGINNQGDVVGNVTAQSPNPEFMAFRFSNGVTTFYQGFGGQSRSYGGAINTAGTIVGYADVNNDDTLATYAPPGSGWVLIPFGSTNDSFSAAISINDFDYTVGYFSGSPILGNTSGWRTSLADKASADFAPVALNNRFDIIGNTKLGGAVYQAWGHTMTYLSTALGTTNNQAQAINQNGVIAGVVGHKGFIYSAGAVTLFGSGIDTVGGVNINGDVVGKLKSGHAFVYFNSSGHFLDLNTITSGQAAGGILVNASGINDGGEICGDCTRPATIAEAQWGAVVYEAFKLHPGYILIPEPPISAHEIQTP